MNTRRSVLTWLRHFVLIACFYIVPEGTAQVLLSWNADDVSSYGPSPWDSAIVSADVELVSGLRRGDGLSPTGAGASGFWGSNNFDTSSSTLENAIAAGDFFTFTIKAASGYSLSLNSLDAAMRRSGTGPSNYQWQYQIADGAFSSVGALTEFTSTSSAGVSQPTITLTAIPDLQHQTSSITFRLIAWGATNGNGNLYLGQSSFDTNDLALSGSLSAIPEPSTYAAILGGLSLVGVIVYRRRRTR